MKESSRNRRALDHNLPRVSTRHDVSLFLYNHEKRITHFPPTRVFVERCFIYDLCWNNVRPRLQIPFQRCFFSTWSRQYAHEIRRKEFRDAKGGGAFEGRKNRVSSAELSSLLGSKEILETRSFNPLVASPSLPRCAIVREGI